MVDSPLTKSQRRFDDRSLDVTARLHTFPLPKGKIEKGLRYRPPIDARGLINAPILTARLPRPSFPKEGIEGGFHPRNESLSKRADLASTRLPENATFLMEGNDARFDHHHRPRTQPGSPQS